MADPHDDDVDAAMGDGAACPRVPATAAEACAARMAAAAARDDHDDDDDDGDDDDDEEEEEDEYDHDAESAAASHNGAARFRAPGDGALVHATAAATVRLVAFGDFGDDSCNDMFKVDCEPRLIVRDALHGVLRGQLPGCPAAFGPHAVLALGDNFYPNGIECGGHEQFAEFVEAYQPLGLPFYACLGNHDYAGNVQAQIDFSGDGARNPLLADGRSRLWTMPGTYYAVRHGPVLVVFLDTNTEAALGPQMAAMARTIREEAAPWVVVAGHHPIVSDDRGVNRRLVALHAFVNEHAHLYLAGHDHTVQALRLGSAFGDWVHREPSAGPLQIVSGAGGNPFSIAWYSHNFSLFRSPEEAGGFVILDASPRELRVRLFSVSKYAGAPAQQFAVLEVYPDKTFREVRPEATAPTHTCAIV